MSVPVPPMPSQAEIVAREKELVEQGWTKQFTTFSDRLEEYVELYIELGWQVQVEPFAQIPSHNLSCVECELSGLLRTIYVRKPLV